MATELTAVIEGKVLVIRIPLQEPTLSASGKNLVVASSHGNQVTDARIQGKNVIVGLNAYVKRS